MEFRDSAGNCLTPDVEGDLLSGTTQPCGTAIQNPDGRSCHCSKPEEGLKRGISKLEGLKLEGAALVGAVLVLGALEQDTTGRQVSRKIKPQYELQIKNVRDTPFWVDCKDCGKKVPIYDFVATNLKDQCVVQMCAPGLDEDKQQGISGTAVIFRGDHYDDKHRVTFPAQGTYDDDLLNIACMGTALSKLHLLRHTLASQPVVGSPQKTPSQITIPQTTATTPTLQKRAQAMLRLLTADYCGNGSTFTRDDLPIKLQFDDPALQLLDASKYNYGVPVGTDTTATIDALWTDAGAACVGTPRYSRLTTEGIRAICMSDNPALKSCADEGIKPPGGFAKPYALGSYAISGNPPKPVVQVQ